MTRSDKVKINIELGKSLRDVIVSDAESSCRKLSWQISYYVRLALRNPPLIKKPDETLDDNEGRITAYFAESVYDELEALADEYDCNFSAVVRASLISGRAISRHVIGDVNVDTNKS
tara:strand:- start:457 stop:807 length:351 start_codon:yes stop_codon:yes gene_type:complete